MCGAVALSQHDPPNQSRCTALWGGRGHIRNNVTVLGSTRKPSAILRHIMLEYDADTCLVGLARTPKLPVGVGLPNRTFGLGLSSWYSDTNGRGPGEGPGDSAVAGAGTGGTPPVEGASKGILPDGHS